eukprot:4196443-Pleurochrysis_carterae.AAC.1
MLLCESERKANDNLLFARKWVLRCGIELLHVVASKSLQSVPIATLFARACVSTNINARVPAHIKTSAHLHTFKTSSHACEHACARAHTYHIPPYTPYPHTQTCTNACEHALRTH